MTTIFKKKQTVILQDSVANKHVQSMHNNTNAKNKNILDTSNAPVSEDKIRSDKCANVVRLVYGDIKNTIPVQSTSSVDLEKQKTHTEWRWVFYTINGRKMIEISKKDPNKNRTFIDNTGLWINFPLDTSLDKYIVDAYYYYVKS